MQLKLFSKVLLGAYLFCLVPAVNALVPNQPRLLTAWPTPVSYVQRNCNLEVQFNKDANKLTSPVQEPNLDQKLPVTCTWYNTRLGSSPPITEDAGMQLTIWVQNDPVAPVKFANDNKLGRINLHCLFEPATNGLGGKKRVDRSGGVDYVSGVMVSKSGYVNPGTFNIMNGNKISSRARANFHLLSPSKYTIAASKNPEHPFDQEIDIKNVSNYATFWDEEIDPLKTTHPAYSQVNIVFLLNSEHPGTNKDNIWYGKNVFNDGDKLSCEVWLPDHYVEK